MTDRPFALIIGGSRGIGRSLARVAASKGYDLLIVADKAVTGNPTGDDTMTRTLTADLSTRDGRQQTIDAVQDRIRHLCLASAGRVLGGAFSDQSPATIRKVPDTNVAGTTMLVHQVAQGMIRRGSGRILLTGSIAGAFAGPVQAVYNASKASVNLLAAGVHDMLAGHRITVTCLTPGATDTRYFTRAGLTDTRLDRSPKSHPDVVARAAWRAMMNGRRSIVLEWHNKAILCTAAFLPVALATLHRAAARPRP